MANERQSTIRRTVTRSDGSRFIFNESTKNDQTELDPLIDHRIVTVTTSETDLTFEHITTPGPLCIKNVGANVIEYGPKNGSNVMEDWGKISPGRIATFELKAGITWRWVALVASTDCLIWVPDE